MRRSDQRRDAVFALYQRDVTGRDLEDLLVDSKPFTRELATLVAADFERLDEIISSHLRGWTLDRIAPLELNIMRVALYEGLEMEEVPIEVAIDEAVETAKEYCGKDAPGFVNGVLGAALEGASGGAE
ncbi:MAG: transcription antitermination factor NusB [bacterium]